MLPMVDLYQRYFGTNLLVLSDLTNTRALRLANSESKAEKSRDRAISVSIDGTESPHSISCVFVNLSLRFYEFKSRKRSFCLPDATVTGIVINKFGNTSCSIIVQIAQHINW